MRSEYDQGRSSQSIKDDNKRVVWTIILIFVIFIISIILGETVWV